VATHVEQVPGQGPDRVGAQPLAVVVAIEEQVDARVAVARGVLLVVLDAPDDLVAQLDREPDTGPVIGEPVVDGQIGIRRVPPAADLGLGKDRAEDLTIGRPKPPERDAGAPQDRRGV
jgi:hypothetical protein